MNFSKNRNEFMILSVLVSLNLGLKIILRNASLSVWDDVEYAYRVQHGMLYAHSPGYPGYMVLGRAFYLVYSFLTRATSEQSMILLSAIFGGLLVVPVYLLIRTLLGKKEAIIGSLFVILNSYLAEMSAQAMSDISSAFFVALAASLLYFGLSKKNNKVILLSAAVYGFSIAIRLTNLVLFPFFIVAAYNSMRRWPNNRTLIALFVSISVLFGVITYIPLLYEKGLSGFIGFLTEYHDVNAVTYTLENMKERTLLLTNNLVDSITPIASVICLIGMWQLYLKRKALFRDLFTWIFAYLFFSVLYGPATQMNRFSLPMYPASAVLFSYGLSGQISKLRRIFTGKKVNISALIACGLLVLVFASIILWSLPTYSGLEYWSENPFPQKLVALWINRTVPTNSTIIGGSYCWVLQYYMDLPVPTSRLIWGSDPSWVTYSVNRTLAEGNYVFIVSVQLESCKFLAENFEIRFYAKYDETLSLYEILPKSSG
jgi:4-amino-4-deoxy-L-arabinose transferase-like glycosyltransferase